jgi:Spy/CpxP family protein refolding chaperone
MDAVFEALAHDMRRQVVAALHQKPGLKHSELLELLGLPKEKAGQLSKLIDPLEGAGIVQHSESRYQLVDAAAAARLLIAAADLDAAAQKALLERAQRRLAEAEGRAKHLRDRLGQPDVETPRLRPKLTALGTESDE